MYPAACAISKSVAVALRVDPVSLKLKLVFKSIKLPNPYSKRESKNQLARSTNSFFFISARNILELTFLDEQIRINSHKNGKLLDRTSCISLADQHNVRVISEQRYDKDNDPIGKNKNGEVEENLG